MTLAIKTHLVMFTVWLYHLKYFVKLNILYKCELKQIISYTREAFHLPNSVVSFYFVVNLKLLQHLWWTIPQQVIGQLNTFRNFNGVIHYYEWQRTKSLGPHACDLTSSNSTLTAFIGREFTSPLAFLRYGGHNRTSLFGLGVHRRIYPKQTVP